MHDETRAPLRFGIAGAGAIARRFCRDVNGHARGAEVVAIAAGIRRADEFARDLGLPHAYGSYEALAASPRWRPSMWR
jgi:predicted dehydrogenase